MFPRWDSLTLENVEGQLIRNCSRLFCCATVCFHLAPCGSGLAPTAQSVEAVCWCSLILKPVLAIITNWTIFRVIYPCFSDWVYINYCPRMPEQTRKKKKNQTGFGAHKTENHGPGCHHCRRFVGGRTPCWGNSGLVRITEPNPTFIAISPAAQHTALFPNSSHPGPVAVSPALLALSLSTGKDWSWIEQILLWDFSF